jgi:hypothetical protein
MGSWPTIRSLLFGLPLTPSEGGGTVRVWVSTSPGVSLGLPGCGGQEMG